MPASIKGKIERPAAADLTANAHETGLLFVSGLEGEMGQILKPSLEFESDLRYHLIQSSAPGVWQS